MTDGAALPLALSDLVWQLRERGLLDSTITCGHAFGGDYEAVSVYSALAVARHIIARRRGDRRDGAGHRRHRDPARVQRHRGRAGARRGRRPRRRADRVPARLVRRPARTAPRRVAPQRDRAHDRHARARAAPGSVRRRRRGTRAARRPRERPGSRIGTSSSTSRRSASSICSSRTACTSCRWAAPRPTIPCSSKPPPRPEWSRRHGCLRTPLLTWCGD